MFLIFKFKKAWLFLILGVIIFLTTVHFPKVNSASSGADILRSYGYEVQEPPLETVTVTIPRQGDPVFESYNALQKESGFDLSPYAGKKVKRVTFEIVLKGKPFRANLLFDGDRLIGGDCCTIHATGEMYPLKGEIYAN